MYRKIRRIIYKRIDMIKKLHVWLVLELKFVPISIIRPKFWFNSNQTQIFDFDVVCTMLNYTYCSLTITFNFFLSSINQCRPFIVSIEIYNHRLFHCLCEWFVLKPRNFRIRVLELMFDFVEIWTNSNIDLIDVILEKVI